MKNLKDNVKKYIYELFIISQCKTKNEFRKRGWVWGEKFRKKDYMHFGFKEM